MKRMNSNETNIELNEKLEDGSIHVTKNRLNPTETNIKLQNEFYENKQTGIAPTYINNETASIRISGDED